MSIYEITIGKEDMKFSSAHFTVFESSVERLHGHNYRVLVTVRARQLKDGLLVDFGVVKQETRRLCGELDELLLLPGTSREVEIRATATEVEVRCRGKRYLLPASDCRILPIDNVSCECLAGWFCHGLLDALGPTLRATGVLSLVAVVEESPGQSGRCEAMLGAE